MLSNMSQEEEVIPFEKIPSYLVKLRKDIKELKEMVEKQFRLHPPEDEWMDVKGLAAYHPDHPSVRTVYDWIHYKRVPYHKDGKRVRFKRTEIDKWLLGGYHRTDNELLEDAVDILNAKRCGQV